MYCEQCGADVQPGQTFCPSCGRPMPSVPEGPVTPAGPLPQGFQGAGQPHRPGGVESPLRYVAAGVAALCGIMLIVCTFLTWVSFSGSFMGISMGMNLSGMNLITGDLSFSEMDMDMNLEDFNLEDLDLEDLDLEDLDLEDLDFEEFNPDDLNLRYRQGERAMSGGLDARLGPVAGAGGPLACTAVSGPAGLIEQGSMKNQIMDELEDEKMPGNFLVRTGETVLFTGFWSLLFGAAIIAAAALIVLRKKAGGIAALGVGGVGLVMAVVNITMVYTTMQPDSEVSSMMSVGSGVGLWMFLAFSLIAVAAGIIAVLAERGS
jgi:hypothetical protein